MSGYELNENALKVYNRLKKTKKEDMNGFKYGILFMVLFVIALLSGLAFIVMKEKEGEPIFMDITTKTPLTPTSKVENA